MEKRLEIRLQMHSDFALFSLVNIRSSNSSGKRLMWAVSGCSTVEDGGDGGGSGGGCDVIILFLSTKFEGKLCCCSYVLEDSYR